MSGSFAMQLMKAGSKAAAKSAKNLAKMAIEEAQCVARTSRAPRSTKLNMRPHTVVN